MLDVIDELSKKDTRVRYLKFEKVHKGKPLCVLGRYVTMDLVLAL